ncbi:cysteine--tRNA ligase [candidate division WS5 bacterium]|uniref:Cysteine--tRNA ligase n=1 Tax=candidate division WS5 bacterium TaxID=2093353 RepID=A0A419DEG5_9BACT|nr:MAG: cysteine--tRNA ligase [candidate division WS5 bacterium]
MNQELYLYNTLTRGKEKFEPLHDKEVGIYTCGPTVYNYAHIGNMRAYIFTDILVRYLRYSGYEVKHVMNITDVGHLTSDSDTGEDKVEKEAKLERKTAWEIAKKYEKAFFEDSAALNIKKPDVVVRATDLISEQIAFIQKLEERGFTYALDDGIYFDSSKSKDYGKLAKLDIKGLRAGERVDIKGKRNKTDFALWKFSPKDKKRDMEWDSPWGKGFPGWHLECSAIGLKYLGEQFDIHTGGIDHINVHHTNEIAQGEALTGKTPAKYWMHSEFLRIGKTRMGKSEGNIVRVTELGVDPLAYRLLVLNTHYRDPLNFTDDAIKSAEIGLRNLRNDIRLLDRIDNESTRDLDNISMLKKTFNDAMNNDLNTAAALAVIYLELKRSRKENVTKKYAQDLKNFIIKIDNEVFGLDLIRTDTASEIVKKLVRDREKARKEKDWEKSDKIRVQIEKQGYMVEDTSQGPVIKKL